MEDWTKLIRTHLGKSLSKNSSSLLWDLILISVGLKPCLLFDYACVDAEKLKNVLEDLQKFGLSLSHSLSVVVLGQDVFIADVKKLLSKLKDNLKNKTFTLVNVSGNLKRPCFVDEKVESQLNVHFTDLVLQLEQHSEQFAFRYDIEVKEMWNLSTIFGFLLCYPVVYWFDTMTDHNCLSLEPLALYKAILTLPYPPSSFDFPFYEIIRSAPFRPNDKVFFAFSCPELLLMQEVLNSIDKWSSNLYIMADTICERLTVRIEKSSVTQKQVTL